MPIKQITPSKQVDENLLQEIEKRLGVAINILSYIGETCLAEARNGGTYMDRTGNLRSSIGYVIINNGRTVKENGFQQVLNGGEGVKEGSKFLSGLVTQNSKGIVLIVVAGMNYAAYVEAKGFNVLTSAELMAEKMVPAMMKQLGFTVR